MKARTVKRHLREGIKNIFRNGWMTIASVGAVTVTLLLVAAFLAVILNLSHMADKVENDVELKVLIDLTADANQIQELGQKIEKMDKVDTVVFSSKEDELENLIKSMGEEGKSWKLFKQDNPLNPAYKVKAKNPQDTAAVANEIKAMPGVHQVNYGKEVVKRLFGFIKYARIVGIVLIAGLVFTAIFLISNTIKLTIMARSREIGIMKLVGATNGFIRWPFFIEGLLLGVLGSIVPIAVLMTGYHYLIRYVIQKSDTAVFRIAAIQSICMAIIVARLGNRSNYRDLGKCDECT
ncbi:permease-like cell division protein FtsX [Virgibacillus halophilus]|uniref:Cell division protein FtsX n=1 Tax=Tigheibacillus halophilus TaxID=361280 RepID=A0ABU5C1Q0_9BACI|nr:permease-like cell division protein FtsX [Virgibacillus halophilus]